MASYFRPPRYLQCYLVLFDPSGKDWEEKLYMKETVYNGKKITMVGL
jgi:hypothetical protein